MTNHNKAGFPAKCNARNQFPNLRNVKKHKEKRNDVIIG